MSKKMPSAVSLVAVLLVASCSGGGTGDSPAGPTAQDAGLSESSNPGAPAGLCKMGAPCGGDVTGTWRFAQVCFGHLGVLKKFCADDSQDESGVRYDGTIKLGADLSFSFSLTRSGSVRMIVPAACLNNGMLTCDQIAAHEEGSTNVAVESVTCATAADGGCTCDAILVTDPTDQTGTYAVNGTSLDLTFQTPMQSVGSDGYCVQGTQLMLYSKLPDSTDPPPGIPMYVLERM